MRCLIPEQIGDFAVMVFVIMMGFLSSMAIALDCDPSLPCMSPLRQKNCKDGQYLELDAERSCCPKCRGGLGFGVSGCNSKNSRRRCAPGLLCVNTVCVLNKDVCTYTYHLRNFRNLPTCEADESFAAKQCKGDMLSGRCFCSDDKGNRIFGFAWRRDSADMFCECSRRRAYLTAAGRLDVTLHCTPKGNYERLQCDDGICWCAHPENGHIELGTRAVVAASWKSLPCYNAEEMGTVYLRQCESASLAQKLQLQALKIRGTKDVAFTALQCDFDGSYGKYTIENGIAACTWRDGKRIGSFQDGSNYVSRMDCQCARDQKIFTEAGLGFTLACTGSGNYDAMQTMNGHRFCVDRDGFPVTDYITNATLVVDCNNFMYNLATAPEDD